MGCGGSSSDANEADATKPSEVEATKAGEAEASKAFLKSGSKNKIARFGEEASAKERAAASKVLTKNLRAREAGDWTTQCNTLSPKAIKDSAEIAEIQGVAGGGCAKELKARAEPLEISEESRVNTLTGSIDALRFKGNRAYALYHGIGGLDYAMVMEKVDGEWKVGDVLEETLGG